LSDRINPDINPFQIDRDILCILSIVDKFKNNLKKKGTAFALDKIRVFFYPHPNNENLSLHVKNLQIDFSKLDLKKRKEKYFLIDSIYAENIKKLYAVATNQSAYHGSDIWRFFKDEINDKCIDSDSTYKNILIIFTDGYMYWKDTIIRDGNRYSFIERKYSHVKKFRDYDNLKRKFDIENYGFIDVQKDLSDLDILVLEVNPSADHPEDFDIIKKYWEKWFIEMKVNQFKILKTDFPANTTPIIESFIYSN